MKKGIYEIIVEGKIITCRLNGSFSEGQAIEFDSKMKEIVGKISPAPFFVIFNLSEFTGATPEAFQVQERFNQWLATTTLVAKANIDGSEIISSIVDHHMPSRKVKLYGCFNSELDAKAWFERIRKELEKN